MVGKDNIWLYYYLPPVVCSIASIPGYESKIFVPITVPENRMHQAEGTIVYVESNPLISVNHQCDCH